MKRQKSIWKVQNPKLNLHFVKSCLDNSNLHPGLNHDSVYLLSWTTWTWQHDICFLPNKSSNFIRSSNRKWSRIKKTTNIYFVQGTKFFIHIVESPITLGSRQEGGKNKHELCMGRWGGQRGSWERGGAESGMMHRAKYCYVQDKGHWGYRWIDGSRRRNQRTLI